MAVDRVPGRAVLDADERTQSHDGLAAATQAIDLPAFDIELDVA